MKRDGVFEFVTCNHGMKLGRDSLFYINHDRKRKLPNMSETIFGLVWSAAKGADTEDSASFVNVHASEIVGRRRRPWLGKH